MIDLIDVSKSYGPGLPAVNHANLHVDKGEFVFIVGNSGSGKSTLIKLLLKELDSTSGTIIVSGEKLEGIDVYKRQNICRERIWFTPDALFLEPCLRKDRRWMTIISEPSVREFPHI